MEYVDNALDDAEHFIEKMWRAIRIPFVLTLRLTGKTVR